MSSENNLFYEEALDAQRLAADSFARNTARTTTMTRPHHIATCTAEGDIIELEDETFGSFEQAATALRAQGYVKAGRNLWTSNRADGTTVHVCTVDMQ